MSTFLLDSLFLTLDTLVQGMGDRVGCVVEAGSTFTVAGTIDNVIHFWGTRNISPITRPNTQVIMIMVMTMEMMVFEMGD